MEVVKTTEDPLQHPKFKFTRIPRAGRISSPPVVLQSPPPQATAEDEKNKMVPPCVSLWKNPKGCAIPLDKRHSAVELEPKISHRVADLAEEKSRDEVALRGKIRRESEMREKERRDKELAGDELGVRERKRRRWQCGEGAGKKQSRRESYEFVDAAYGDGDDEVETTIKMRERERPIKFEKEDADDLFGLDELLSELNQ